MHIIQFDSVVTGDRKGHRIDMQKCILKKKEPEIHAHSRERVPNTKEKIASMPGSRW